MKPKSTSAGTFVLPAGALVAAIGGAMLVATCAAGTVVGKTALAPDSSGKWTGRIAAPLRVGKTAAVDLWIDCGGSGDLDYGMVATANGKTERGGNHGTTKGAVTGRLSRAGVFTVTDPGPWEALVELKPSGEVQVSKATALLKEGAFDGNVSGAITLAAGIFLTLLGLAMRP